MYAEATTFETVPAPPTDDPFLSRSTYPTPTQKMESCAGLRALYLRESAGCYSEFLRTPDFAHPTWRWIPKLAALFWPECFLDNVGGPG